MKVFGRSSFPEARFFHAISCDCPVLLINLQIKSWRKSDCNNFGSGGSTLIWQATGAANIPGFVHAMKGTLLQEHMALSCILVRMHACMLVRVHARLLACSCACARPCGVSLCVCV